MNKFILFWKKCFLFFDNFFFDTIQILMTDDTYLIILVFKLIYWYYGYYLLFYFLFLYLFASIFEFSRWLDVDCKFVSGIFCNTPHFVEVFVYNLLHLFLWLCCSLMCVYIYIHMYVCIKVFIYLSLQIFFVSVVCFPYYLTLDIFPFHEHLIPVSLKVILIFFQWCCILNSF